MFRSWRLTCKRVAATICLIAGTLAAQTRPLTILHTNDLHARLLPLQDGRGGFAELAALIRQERAGCRWCLLVNAGDLVQGSPVSTIYRGLPVYRIANLFGYDVSTIGNHDFDYGWQRLRDFQKTAKFPLVSANVVDEGGRLLVRRPYVIRKVNGLRVAIIGAETNMLGGLTTPKLLGPWHTAPLIDSVRRYAAEARGKSDIVIVLAHVGDSEERQLLEQVPEAPVIITGHVHDGIPAAQERDGRILVRTKAYAEELGRLDLQVDVRKKSVASWKWQHIKVDGRLKPAPDVAKAVAHWEKEVSRVVDVPVAESARQFDKKEVKALVERAMRDRMGADFAFMNFGGVRDVIPQGRVLARHIWNIIPFDNLVVVGKFKGSQIPEVVREGKTLDPEREYTLAVSDFTAANQSGRSELRSKGLQFSQQGPLLRDVLLDWVKQKKLLE
jgi:2',3'-cyclic-nucleotide 2'-phosphodiesterase (5'-nucleotidase family)